MTNKRHLAILHAILAALLFGISSPISKLLLKSIPPAWMAALLYLGAGSGMAFVRFCIQKRKVTCMDAWFSVKEIPFIVLMILLDIAAPILLMTGLAWTNAATVSLLNNFEIVATSLIAYMFFKETVGKRLWSAIALITLASFILSMEDAGHVSFSWGAMLVLLACLCWGLENNCTRVLSVKNPMDVVLVKGFGSGLGAAFLAFLGGARFTGGWFIAAALLLGFFSYGLSIFFYVSAQRELGAAKTSAYYALAPFIGVLISCLILQEVPGISFWTAFLLMIAGTCMIPR